MKNLLIVLTLCLAQATVSATILRVNNQPVFLGNPICDNCYEDLPEAVAAAVPFQDTIHVEASPDQYSDITLNKQVTIIGPGYFLTDNPGFQVNNNTATLSDVTFAQGSSGSRIMGITISGSSHNIFFSQSWDGEDILVKRCNITYVSISSFAENFQDVIFRQCWINSGVTHGSSYNADFNGLVLDNCYIGGNVSLNSHFSGRISHCVIEGNVSTFTTMDVFNNVFLSENASSFPQNNNDCSNWYNNIIAAELPWLDCSSIYDGVTPSTVLVDATNIDLETDLVLQPESVCPGCYDAYFAEQIGVYGGLTPYINAGIPDIPSIFLLYGTPAAYPGQQIEIEIGTQTNQ